MSPNDKKTSSPEDLYRLFGDLNAHVDLLLRAKGSKRDRLMFDWVRSGHVDFGAYLRLTALLGYLDEMGALPEQGGPGTKEWKSHD